LAITRFPADRAREHGARVAGGGAEPAKKRSEQIRIEQVRELADFLAVGTHRGGVRVILIYPAEAMNANTQNALLKNLEEPPLPQFFCLSPRSPSAWSRRCEAAA